MALHNDSNCLQEELEDGSVQQHLDESEVDQDVVDDGTGRFFLKDKNDMEEIDVSSISSSSPSSFTHPVGEDSKHLVASGSRQHQPTTDENQAVTLTDRLKKRQGGERLLADCMDKKDDVESCWWASQGLTGKVSPYLEFQRAVSARSGAKIRMSSTEADGGPSSLLKQLLPTSEPADVRESSDMTSQHDESSCEPCSSQVTPFSERMGTCDASGWYWFSLCLFPDLYSTQ